MALTRRTFLAVGAAAGLGRPVMTAQSGGGSRRPKNVLLIMSDQHKPQCLGVAGDPVARTPNLDALARSGVRFSSAYCSNPVCTPSRASLLTGLYTHNHHAWGNTTPWPFSKKTIAHHFSRAGYMSALVGKMHFVDAQTHGFDYHLDFNDWLQYLGPKAQFYADELGRPNSGSGLPQIDDLWRDAGDPWKNLREKDGRMGSVAVGHASKMDEESQFDSFVARESVRFLRNHGKEQPFFLVTSFLKPHDPFMPATRFANLFRAEDMKLPSTFGKVDLSSVPQEIRRSITESPNNPELRDPEQAKQRIAMYYANLAQMDHCAGQVLSALQELGLDDDTIVVYTSDHGEMLGEHGLWHKFVFYESSVCVPLMFRVPGNSNRGAASQTPVSLTQVMPTLLDVCGVPIPSGLDGTSLAGDLQNPGVTRDTTVFSEFALTTPAAKYMIRRGDYKFSYYVSDKPELYNLRTDPQEMRNLAGLPEFASKAAEMKKSIFDWYRPPEKAR